MAEGTFATAVNCMDGRVQLPVVEYLKKKLGIDYIDMVTEPGPIKFLAENVNKSIVESIKNRVGISVNKHGSKVVAIVGHDDCAGNPVERSVQVAQIKKSVELAKKWDFDVQFLTLFVNKSREVEEI